MDRPVRIPRPIRGEAFGTKVAHLFVVRLLVGVALVTTTVSAALPRHTGSDSPALKPISQTALQRLVDSTARELLVPGALVLLRTPQHEFVATYGTTQLGTTNRPGVDTYFRIASNTKTMTAAVILQMAQEGLLSLRDPISKYVPNVPNGDNITIAELLEMRSGIYNYTNAPELSAAIDHDHAKVWTTGELLAIAFAHPPNFPPGTAYEYCNTNYALLGLVGERLGGKPLALAMAQRLFRPLGMRHTLLPAASVNTMPKPYSHGYLYGSSSVALVGTPPYSSEVQAAARAGTLLPTDYTDVSPSFALAPAASSPRQTTLPPGSRLWSAAEFSTTSIKPAGETACDLRTSPMAWSTDTASSGFAGPPTRCCFTAARPPATSPSLATTPPMESRWLYGPIWRCRSTRS